MNEETRCRALVAQMTAFGADRKEVKSALTEAADEIERLRAVLANIIEKRVTYGWGFETDAAIDAARKDTILDSP